MIAQLQGTVLYVGQHHAVIDVSGVGYKVLASPTTLASLKEGKKAVLLIHTAVREDALDLYGFLHEDERGMFELLLTVSNIGPKSALAILSLADAHTLASAIVKGKASYLTSVSGIGKKTAEKIVMELKDKVSGFGMGGVIEGDESALEALRGMGYSLKEAREALKRVPDDVVGESARLRKALRKDN
jgi:holliday junction DNA helicase RuvA